MIYYVFIFGSYNEVRTNIGPEAIGLVGASKNSFVLGRYSLVLHGTMLMRVSATA